MTQPWDRQPDETAPAWAAFQTYRDMAPGDRSISAALEASGRKAGNQRLFETWSSRHGWPSRVAAWDAHLDRLAQARIAKTVTERAERQAKLGRNLQAIAALPANELARRLEAGTLDLKALTAKELMDLSARLATAAKQGADIENLAVGDVTDRTALRVDPHLERLRALVESEAGHANGADPE